MSDLKEIKFRIYKEERIDDLIEALGCPRWQIEQGGNLFTAQLPDGDNHRSVQIKNNENLTLNIRSKGISGDIYALVNYIIYDIKNESESQENLHKAKRWICENLGYKEYLDRNYVNKSLIYNEWLLNIKKKRKKHKKIIKNEPIDQNVMNQYYNYPHRKWIEEGINADTQIEFGVAYDIDSDRIVFPIHNKYGEIVGVKGRLVNAKTEYDKKKKYNYPYPCNKSVELYNYHRALEYIQREKEVIVFEGAKTVMLAWQNGIKNCVSTEGFDISDEQIKLLISLGVDITLAYDKDKTVGELKDVVDMFKAFDSQNKIYILYDLKNIFDDKKASPFDEGFEKFKQLYSIKMPFDALYKLYEKWLERKGSDE